MRKIWMLGITLLLSVVWIQAQQYPDKESSQSSKTKSAEKTIQGCLQGSDGNFTLTDDAGKSYQIQGDTSKLADHVGHEVQITGTASTSTSQSESTSRSPEAGTASSTSHQRTIELQDIKHISKTCKSAGK